LRNQTLDPALFEIIISDDRSRDDTFEVFRSFRPLMPNLKYIYSGMNSDWNASRPRNLGAKISSPSTTHFVFLDSDVCLRHDALSNYYEDLQSNPSRVVIGVYHWLDPITISERDITEDFDNLVASHQYQEDFRMVSFNEVSGPDEVRHSVYDALACFSGNIMIPRSAFWKAGGYDENILKGCEDGDLGLTLWEMGVGFSFDKRIVGLHLWHPRPPDRDPGLHNEVAKLRAKHRMDIVDVTGKAYRRWGIDWTPDPHILEQERIEEDLESGQRPQDPQEVD
jgi:GT2 family glycosyltransferase